MLFKCLCENYMVLKNLYTFAPEMQNKTTRAVRLRFDATLPAFRKVETAPSD